MKGAKNSSGGEETGRDRGAMGGNKAKFKTPLLESRKGIGEFYEKLCGRGKRFRRTGRRKKTTAEALNRENQHVKRNGRLHSFNHELGYGLPRKGPQTWTGGAAIRQWMG